MPIKKKILEHWINRLPSFNKTQPQRFYFALAGKTEIEIEKQIRIFNRDFCFACGLHKLTQRCHIDAEKKEEIDDVENLHLLCISCHYESEGLRGKQYWDWFREKDESLALKYYIDSHMSVFKRFEEEMRQLRPIGDFTLDEIKDFIKKNFSIALL